MNYPFLVFSLVVWFNAFSFFSTTNYFPSDLKAHSAVQASIFIYMFVCVYELWVGWEQEVTHSGIPQALGFDLLGRAVQECGSNLKHHLETKSWQTTLVPQSRWNCNGFPFYHKLCYQDQLQYLNSCCTGFPFLPSALTQTGPLI